MEKKSSFFCIQPLWILIPFSFEYKVRLYSSMPHFNCSWRRFQVTCSLPSMCVCFLDHWYWNEPYLSSLIKLSLQVHRVRSHLVLKPTQSLFRLLSSAKKIRWTQKKASVSKPCIKKVTQDTVEAWHHPSDTLKASAIFLSSFKTVTYDFSNFATSPLFNSARQCSSINFP